MRPSSWKVELMAFGFIGEKFTSLLAKDRITVRRGASSGEIEYADLVFAVESGFAPLDSPTFTGNVLIPDGEADGEALAYAQDDAVLQGLTVTKSAAPAYTLYELGEAADKGRWRIAVSGSDLYVQQMTDAGVFIKSPMVFNRDDATDFSGSTAVTVPVPTTTGHALRQGSDASVAALTATGNVTGPNVEAIGALVSELFVGENSANGVKLVYDGDTNRGWLRAESGGVDIDIAEIVRSSGQILFKTPTSVPAATAATHAAQVSAIDAATGKYEIGGKRGLNSTPWRKVLSWTAGVQDAANQIGVINTAEYSVNGTGYMLLMREGSTVRVSMPNGNVDSLRKLNVGAHDLMSSGSVPLSYVCGTEQRYFNTASSYSGTETGLSMDSASTTAMWRFNTTLSNAYLNNVSASYYSSVAAPSTLPGAAV
jgi:hypothetical protein